MSKLSPQQRYDNFWYLPNKLTLLTHVLIEVKDLHNPKFIITFAHIIKTKTIMCIFEDIKRCIEISDVQAYQFFHKKLKNESFSLIKRYKAYQFMERLIKVVGLNNIPYTAKWCNDAYKLHSPQLYQIDDNNKIKLHNDVITYDNCTEILYNNNQLIINIFRQNYSCVSQDYEKYLSCSFTIQVEDMNIALKSFLISDLFLDEIKTIARQYYTQMAYDKLLDMCIGFVKKDMEELA